jgi:hypothetical protein
MKGFLFRYSGQFSSSVFGGTRTKDCFCRHLIPTLNLWLFTWEIVSYGSAETDQRHLFSKLN